MTWSDDRTWKYKARGGRVWVVFNDGETREASTAIMANGRDLARHDAALNRARKQRERIEREPQPSSESTDLSTGERSRPA